MKQGYIKTKYFRLAFASAAIALGSLCAMAVPAKPGIRTVNQPDGSTLKIRVVGDERMHFTLSEEGFLLHKDADGFFRLGKIDSDGAVVSTGVMPRDAGASKVAVVFSDKEMSQVAERRQTKRKAPQSGMGLLNTAYPVTGSPKALVILVEYSDVKFRSSYDARAYFTDLIKGENFQEYRATGSALQYFIDQSGGKFIPDFDVLGPVALPNTQSYYGYNDRWGDEPNAHLMITDAIEILDPDVDFSVYDTDGDGLLDNVYVFYAGHGEADYGSEDTVWPHTWDIRYAGINMKVDGVRVGHYACSNEWTLYTPSGIGTFVHEYSHVLGLPDLYHTTSSSALYTPGDYSVLDSGPYNNDGRTPPNYGAYEKNALGWYEPLVVTEPCSITLDEISSGEFVLIPTSKDSEFFLFENRQLSGWDEYIPAHGMLIWHIDYVESVFEQNAVNNKKNHQYVDIVEANNSPTFDDADGFTFPGTTGSTSFTADTTPAFKDWSGNTIAFPITDITENEGIISFNVAGGGDQIVLSSPTVETGRDSEPVYFSLCGTQVLNPQKGMMLIKRTGNKTEKIIF